LACSGLVIGIEGKGLCLSTPKPGTFMGIEPTEGVVVEYRWRTMIVVALLGATTAAIGTGPAAGAFLPEVDLSVSKTINQASLYPGGEIEFLISWTNFGTGLGQAVQLIDTLPPELAYDTAGCGDRFHFVEGPAAGTPAPCPTQVGSQLFWDLPDVPGGGHWAMTARLGISGSADPSPAVLNCATVETSIDSDPSNNVNCIGFAVDPPPTCDGLIPTILGYFADETITGTDGDDVIYAAGGDDTVDGGLGSDSICGGEGRDTLIGGDGSDLLVGEAGNDRLYGGPGRDRLLGGLGRDWLYGGDGRDLMKGGRQLDRLWGGPGDDRLLGGQGNDELSGQEGDDQMWGQRGFDTLSGNCGVDWADGGLHTDVCVAETSVNCE
jgi:uncharacterized repeat protein (TIGR01451 family)